MNLLLGEDVLRIVVDVELVGFCMDDVFMFYLMVLVFGYF